MIRLGRFLETRSDEPWRLARAFRLVVARRGLARRAIFAAALPALLALLPASPLSAQSYPSVRGQAQSPVDIPQTNLTPVQQPFSPAPSVYGTPASPYGAAPYGAAPYTAAPPSGYAVPAATGYQPPPTYGSTPTFDPYQTGPGMGSYQPAYTGPPPVPTLPGYPGGMAAPPPSTQVPPPSFGLGNPGFNTAPGFSQPYGASPFTGPTTPSGYPSTAMPFNAPTSLYPGGVVPSNWGPTVSIPNALQAGRGPRVSYGYIYDSDSADSITMNEFDSGIGLGFPDFVRSGQPLVVSPGFGVTLLDGPNSSTGADLPGSLFSLYTDIEWQSDPNQMFSIDLGTRLGFYTDFDADFADSFRFMGHAIGNFRLSPFTTFKGGVMYLDRNEIDWLPAVGLIYTPSPVSRWEIFFPEPKWTHYCSTLGTSDLWFYVAGQYGGGNWNVERQFGGTEDVDLNDIRLLVGWEWGRNDLLRNGTRTGFFEFGYVFDREVIYRNNPQDNLFPTDTLMFRTGLHF